MERVLGQQRRQGVQLVCGRLDNNGMKPTNRGVTVLRSGAPCREPGMAEVGAPVILSLDVAAYPGVIRTVTGQTPTGSGRITPKETPVPRFAPVYAYSNDPKTGFRAKIVSGSDPRTFTARVLGLGDLRTPASPVDVLAAVFDLEGFTNFTKQVDPQLTVPSFLSDFLEWLCAAIRSELTPNDDDAGTLYAELPFMAKFMGDGVLFLWRLPLEQIAAIDPKRPAAELAEDFQTFVTNIVATLTMVCKKYRTDFLPGVAASYVEPPSRLRCGIARGTVIPVGTGRDFVGPCINIAARLQKFHDFSFAFSARGIDASAFHADFANDFIKKRVAIRGIGDSELVYVSAEEFAALAAELQEQFRDP